MNAKSIMSVNELNEPMSQKSEIYSNFISIVVFDDRIFSYKNLLLFIESESVSLIVSVCLIVCLSVFLSTDLSASQSVSQPVCQSEGLFVELYLHLSL